MNVQPPDHLRLWKRYAFAVVVATVAYLALIWAVPLFSSLVVENFPENYAWQVRNALASGDIARAKAVASKQLNTEHYDFSARRLMAEVFIEEGRTSDAVEVLLESLQRGRTIKGRDIYSIGFDPAADYILLSTALEQQGRFAFASEMQRAGLDEKSISTTTFKQDDRHSSVGQHLAMPPSGATKINLSSFKLSSGASITSDGGIAFSRNSTAMGSIPVRATGENKLWLQVAGRAAMGISPLLKVSGNGSIIAIVYADTTRPRWIKVPLPETDTASSIELTLQFLNDGFDPITKADRNVELLQLLID